MRAEELCLPLLFAPRHMTVHQRRGRWGVRTLGMECASEPVATTPSAHKPLPVLLSAANGPFRLQGLSSGLAAAAFLPVSAQHSRVKRQLCCFSQDPEQRWIACSVCCARDFFFFFDALCGCVVPCEGAAEAFAPCFALFAFPSLARGAKTFIGSSKISVDMSVLLAGEVEVAGGNGVGGG